MHPDKNKDDPQANEKFAEIGNGTRTGQFTEICAPLAPPGCATRDPNPHARCTDTAYEVLIDPEKRPKYDMYGEDGLKPDGGGGGGGFGDFFGFGGGRQNQGEKRKDDIPMDIEVTLQELYLGSSRTVRLRRQILCPACRGTGAKDGEVENCNKCGGKGFTLERRQVGPGFIQQVQVDCKKCEGTGKISKAECPVCEGKKVQTGDKDIEVYIEQGMPDGAEILFEGEGDQGPGESPSHLKFFVRTVPHKLFVRDGEDLHIDVHIDLMEALFGFSRTIEHLDGHAVNVERKGVTKPGAKEIVKKEGMPVHNFPSDRGDLVANFIIDMPKELTAEQKAVIAEVF